MTRSSVRWIVGAEDTAQKTWILGLSLAIWIGLDIVTKVAALALLDEETHLELAGVLGLTLLINETLVAAPTLQDLEAAQVTGAEVLVVVLAMMAGALIAIPFANATRAIWKRVLLVLGALFVPVLIASELAPLVELGQDVSFRALMPARIAGSTAMIVLLLRSVRAPILVLALATVLGGNLGNALNALYEPRGVVDFVYVPAIGPWVFNVADDGDVGGVILFAVGLVTSTVQAVQKWVADREASRTVGG